MAWTLDDEVDVGIEAMQKELKQWLEDYEKLMHDLSEVAEILTKMQEALGPPPEEEVGDDTLCV